jgi:hypothetical protein
MHKAVLFYLEQYMRKELENIQKSKEMLKINFHRSD